MEANPRQVQVLLCGYYGEHNLGDDALLYVLLEQLPKGCVPVVTAHDQAQVSALHGVRTIDRRRLAEVLRGLGGCDALVLGGGSLLQDATSRRSLLYYAVLILAARLQGKPVLLWGQGLGPLRGLGSRLLVRALLPLVSAISWRDPVSAGVAASWGVRSLQGSDPVWSFPPIPWHGDGGPIVLCWRPVRQIEGPGWEPYLSALDRLAACADRQVLWVPFHGEQDQGLLARLHREGRMSDRLRDRSREVVVVQPQEAMEVFAGAGLVLAMRLHGLILAALSGSPCFALSYDPKVSAAAAGIGCGSVDLNAAPPEDLDQLWRAHLDQPADSERIENQRQATWIHRQTLSGLKSQAGAP